MGVRQWFKDVIYGRDEHRYTVSKTTYSSIPLPSQQFPPTAATSQAYPPLFNPLTAPQDVFDAELEAAKHYVGGRLSQDKEGMFFGKYRVVLPPNDTENNWRLANLDEETLSRISPANLMAMLADLSPDVSKALWDFLRFCNPGYEWVAYRKNPKIPDERATKATQAFVDTLIDHYGSFDVVVNKMFFGAFLRGAILCELVLDADARTPIDLVTPDPSTIRFIRYNDDIRGWVNMPAQYQRGGLVMLDRPTVRYVPVDPFPGDPYGRPLVTPALFSSLFLLGLLHDLRRVIAQQGYPRLDLSINLEALKATMPVDARSNPAILQQWIDDTIKEVQTLYSQLEPDDAFVHLNSIEVKNPVGAVSNRALGGLGDLIEFIERMTIRALKTMPLLMAVTEGVSEANANRQWEIHVAGIKSLQHPAETCLERLFTLALQAQGIPGKVQFRFQELRAAEELRDQQTLTLKVNNNFQMQMNGWIDADEAAMNVVSHKSYKKEPLTDPSLHMKENFEGFTVPAANNAEVKGQPTEQQPNANPTKAQAGGNQKKKNKQIDPHQANPERELTPEFKRQYLRIVEHS